MQPRPTAALFDLDGTLIEGSSSEYLVRHLLGAGLVHPTVLLRFLRYDLLYRFNRIDANELFRWGLGVAARTGLDLAQLREIVERVMHEAIVPRLYTSMLDVVEEHRRAGHALVLCTAAPDYVAESLGALLGFDAILCTPTPREGDRLGTGVPDVLCYGAGKVDYAREWARSSGHDLSRSFFYSDSASDLPLLRAVGHPRVVNPQWMLRLVALRRGWPRLTATTASRGGALRRAFTPVPSRARSE